MIKLERTDVYGVEPALRGMRNPMNSWDKSDTLITRWAYCDEILIGENDLDLIRRLIKGGTEHRKFLRMINVTVDITAPLYWWKEFDTYKVGTVANSCSTMHKIHEKQFTPKDFSNEHLFPVKKDGSVDEELLMSVKGSDAVSSNELLSQVIWYLNYWRNKFLETKDKKYWWQMIQLLPSSYNQKRTVQLNYEVLLTQYRQRKGHKLDEWNEYCEWIESLPHMAEFIEVSRKNASKMCKTCIYHCENKCKMNIGVWKDEDFCSLWKNN